jgi:hypothetical protein
LINFDFDLINFEFIKKEQLVGFKNFVILLFIEKEKNPLEDVQWNTLTCIPMLRYSFFCQIAVFADFERYLLENEK